MNWKKILISLMVFAVGATMFIAGAFYALDALRVARGLKPVLLRAPRDLTEIIPSAEEEMKEDKEKAKNKTDMPLRHPEEFSISIFAKDLGGPRVMMWGPDGTMWVSVPSQGKVMALKDANGDGAMDEAITMARGLNRPHGLASKCDADNVCKIYIAESDQIAAYDYDRAQDTLMNKKKIIDLPDGGRHFTRTIMFMPAPNENKLLISVGSSCDVCEESDWRRGKILIANADGSNLKEYAK